MRTQAIGFLMTAIAVACGAMGAHLLEARLDARGLELWETGSRYLLYGGLGVVVLGLAGSSAPGGLKPAEVLVGVGTAIFSGTLFAMALGGPNWLGAITPLGGVGMISGFCWAAWRRLRQGRA